MYHVIMICLLYKVDVKLDCFLLQLCLLMLASGVLCAQEVFKLAACKTDNSIQNVIIEMLQTVVQDSKENSASTADALPFNHGFAKVLRPNNGKPPCYIISTSAAKTFIWLVDGFLHCMC